MLEQMQLFPAQSNKNIRLYIEHDMSVDRWISEHHYLHSTPAGAILRMVFKDQEDKVIGCMMWGRPTSRKIEQVEVLELTRMCFLEDTERFVESKALAMSRKYIRKHLNHIKGLIAYSSTGAGHEGVIYKADNWYQLGGSKGGSWENRSGRIDRDLSQKIRWTRSP